MDTKQITENGIVNAQFGDNDHIGYFVYRDLRNCVVTKEEFEDACNRKALDFHKKIEPVLPQSALQIATRFQLKIGDNSAFSREIGKGKFGIILAKKVNDVELDPIQAGIAFYDEDQKKLIVEVNGVNVEQENAYELVKEKFNGASEMLVEFGRDIIRRFNRVNGNYDEAKFRYIFDSVCKIAGAINENEFRFVPNIPGMGQNNPCNYIKEIADFFESCGLKNRVVLVAQYKNSGIKEVVSRESDEIINNEFALICQEVEDFFSSPSPKGLHSKKSECSKLLGKIKIYGELSEIDYEAKIEVIESMMDRLNAVRSDEIKIVGGGRKPTTGKYVGVSEYRRKRAEYHAEQLKLDPNYKPKKGRPSNGPKINIEEEIENADKEKKKRGRPAGVKNGEGKQNKRAEVQTNINYGNLTQEQIDQMILETPLNGIQIQLVKSNGQMLKDIGLDEAIINSKIQELYAKYRKENFEKKMSNWKEAQALLQAKQAELPTIEVQSDTENASVEAQPEIDNVNKYDKNFDFSSVVKDACVRASELPEGEDTNLVECELGEMQYGWNATKQKYTYQFSFNINGTQIMGEELSPKAIVRKIMATFE